ncbi:SIR2 family protein [Pontibacter harenae]|uniref:SIR2 family protein n=1 Tax=Pontibacter harenae TaxID=2894083 RepID=UPI001E51054F|nr:SIR2 family protein [Pontibacter harenae]MCC9167376.1 SIR2 family protein [Pontibacter harenae]
MENIKPEVEQIAELIKKSKIKIFCGAGISFNSGVPLVDPLVTNILEAFGATKEEIAIYKAHKYPFEALMGDIGFKYDGHVEKLTRGHMNSLFQIGSPNNNHYFISNLYKKGFIDKVVTTNFDCLIEKALEKDGSYKSFKTEAEFDKVQWHNSDRTLIKIHGCISDPSSIRTSLEAVSNRFLHPQREKVIRNTFQVGDHEAVLVLGYSFSDHFDITPFLKEIGRKGKKLYIIHHSCFDKPTIQNISDVFPQIGAFDGKVICGSTNEIIKNLVVVHNV